YKRRLPNSSAPKCNQSPRNNKIPPQDFPAFTRRELVEISLVVEVKERRTIPKLAGYSKRNSETYNFKN
ncbi:MAG: hypothetical protein ACI9V1_001477, partial [Spirosomataceae bacterium]